MGTGAAMKGDVGSQFLGTWSLVSCEDRVAGGSVTLPFGEEPVGQLIYDSGGHMMVQLMRRDRARFASENPRAAMDQEIIPAFASFLSYFGTFEVDEKAGVVTHRLRGSSFPNWTGGDQHRLFEFKDGRLILATPPINVGGKEVASVLTWERAMALPGY
jgi:hypothetical protein